MTSEENTKIESRLPDLLDKFQKRLQKIDTLERKLEEKVAEKRTRALNILDELPTFRSSTLRLYITHTFEEAVEKETKVVSVETPPQIHPSIDNPFAPIPTPPPPQTKEIVVESNVNKWSTVIEGKLLVTDKDHQSAAAFERASKALALKDGGRVYQTQNDSESIDTSDMSLRERTATRFMHDREGEEHLVPVKFTHYFDRISVTFQTFQEDKAMAEMLGKKTPSKRNKKKNAKSPTPPPVLNKYSTNGLKTSLFWNRERATAPGSGASKSFSMDTHAFHALYTEPCEEEGLENTVVATIRLHRKELKAKYKPSSTLCSSLLPFLVPKKAPIEHSETAPPEHNDVQIPTVLTMEEAVGAVEFYVRENKLWTRDAEGTMKITNDDKLEQLFGVKEMTMGELQRLFLSRGLLVPCILGTPGDSPVVLKYVLTKDKATNAKDAAKSDNDKESEDKLDQPIPKRRRVDDKMDNSAHSAVSDNEFIPNLLTCDISVDVAHLYHSQCREILRRVKIREYDYASCRTKALRTVEHTKASEDTVKDRLENIVRQRGLTTGHQPLLAVLAKESPEGSETRIAAHLDMKTALLVEKLEDHVERASACWEIVNKSRGVVDN